MPAYFDIYVLAPERTGGIVNRFLDTFLPARAACADELQVQMDGDVEGPLFTDQMAAVRHLADHPRDAADIYWRATSEDRPEHASAHFLRDGALVLSLATADEPPSFALAFKRQLMAFCCTDQAFVGHEAAPGFETLDAFRELVRAFDGFPETVLSRERLEASARRKLAGIRTDLIAETAVVEWADPTSLSCLNRRSIPEAARTGFAVFADPGGVCCLDPSGNLQAFRHDTQEEVPLPTWAVRRAVDAVEKAWPHLLSGQDKDAP